MLVWQTGLTPYNKQDVPKIPVKLFEALGNYPVYFLVGSFSAAVSISTREVVGHSIGDQATAGYMISMVVAYALGIVVSYTLNRRFTFKPKTTGQAQRREQFLFVATALLGMGITIGLSLSLRHLLEFLPFLPDWPNTRFEHYRNTLAFAIAALTTSVVTYTLNKRFTFHEK